MNGFWRGMLLCGFLLVFPLEGGACIKINPEAKGNDEPRIMTPACEQLKERISDKVAQGIHGFDPLPSSLEVATLAVEGVRDLIVGTKEWEAANRPKRGQMVYKKAGLLLAEVKAGAVWRFIQARDGAAKEPSYHADLQEIGSQVRMEDLVNRALRIVEIALRRY